MTIKKLMLITPILWLTFIATNNIYGNNIKINTLIIKKNNGNWQMIDEHNNSTLGAISIDNNQLTIKTENNNKASKKITNVREATIKQKLTNNALCLTSQGLYQGTSIENIIIHKGGILNYNPYSSNIQFTVPAHQQILLDAIKNPETAQIFCSENNQLYEIDIRRSSLLTWYDYEYVISIPLLLALIATYYFIKIR